MVCMNPSVTWAVVLDHPNFEWEWSGLSLNSQVTWDIVKANLDRPWDWQTLCINKNITPEIVRAHPTYNWNWWCLNRNFNLTWDDSWEIGWNWDKLANFSLAFPSSAIARIRRCFAARKIQLVFLDAYYNPAHKFCQNRLRREFTDLGPTNTM